MKIQIKNFYYISNAHDTLKITTFREGVLPILWNNKGLYCIISRQKVQNVFDLITDKSNLPQLNQKQVDTFHWSEGEPISARAAAMLLS